MKNPLTLLVKVFNKLNLHTIKNLKELSVNGFSGINKSAAFSFHASSWVSSFFPGARSTLRRLEPSYQKQSELSSAVNHFKFSKNISSKWAICNAFVTQGEFSLIGCGSCDPIWTDIGGWALFLPTEYFQFATVVMSGWSLSRGLLAEKPSLLTFRIWTPGLCVTYRISEHFRISFWWLYYRSVWEKHL